MQFSRLVVEEAFVSRKRLVVDPDKNPRKYKGELEPIGVSLDKQGQTDPLIVVPVPGARKNKSDLGVRDGFRRTAAIDEGYCPAFRTADRIWVHILRTADGGAPAEIEVQRYCATRNNVRLNWSEIEQASYFRMEIEHSLRVEAAKVELSTTQRKRLRARTIELLGSMFGLTPRTVRLRLQLLTFSAEIQRAILTKKISIAVAMKMLRAKAPPEDMLRLLKKAEIAAASNGHRTARPHKPGRGGVGRAAGAATGGRNGKSPKAINTGNTGAWPRIRERTIDTVLAREGLGKPKRPEVRPPSWFQEQMENVRNKLQEVDPEKDPAQHKLLKAVLQTLRCGAGELERMPV